MFSVLLSGTGCEGGAAAGGPEAGTGGGCELGSLDPSTDTLLLSFAGGGGAVPLASWWFSRASGSVAARLASASLSAEGGAGGGPLGGPDPPPPLTVSDLKNSSRLLCNWKFVKKCLLVFVVEPLNNLKSVFECTCKKSNQAEII